MKPGDPGWERSADNWAELQEADRYRPVSDEEEARIREAVAAGRIVFEPGWNTPPFPDPLGPRDIRELVMDLYPIWRTIGVALALCILAAVVGLLTG